MTGRIFILQKDLPDQPKGTEYHEFLSQILPDLPGHFHPIGNDGGVKDGAVYPP